MAQKTTPEERQMIKLIEKLNVPQEQKASWVESVQNSGLTEEVAEEIRLVLITPSENEQPPEAITRTRYMMEFSQLVKRWRISYQSRHFNRR